MANDVGQGMRRRNGEPMSYMGDVGAKGASTGMTSDSAYETARQAGSARIALGEDAPHEDHDVMSPEQDAGDEMGQVATASERLGASYRVTADISSLMEPSHGPTQNQGRIVPSVRGRQNPNFQSGIQTAES